MTHPGAEDSGSAASLPPTGQSLPSSEIPVLLRELGKRLGDLDGRSGAIDEAAQLMLALYRSGCWRSLGASSWEAWLESEGLRGTDLDPNLTDAALQAFACAMVRAGLTQATVAAVVGVSQKSVSRYVTRASRSDGPATRVVPAVDTLRSSAPAQAASNREFAESVVGELLREAAAAPPVPASALILALTKVEEVSLYVGEFLSGLSAGSALTSRGEGLRRKAVRELEGLAEMLRTADDRPGIPV